MKLSSSDRKRFRIKNKVKKVSNLNRYRLCVYRSSKNISAQVIDDKNNKTLFSASSIEKEQKISGTNIEAASKIGTLVAQRAIKKGVKTVIFDRGGYKYHGRVKALADAARTAGLEF